MPLKGRTYAFDMGFRLSSSRTDLLEVLIALLPKRDDNRLRAGARDFDHFHTIVTGKGSAYSLQVASKMNKRQFRNWFRDMWGIPQLHPDLLVLDRHLIDDAGLVARIMSGALVSSQRRISATNQKPQRLAADAERPDEAHVHRIMRDLTELLVWGCCGNAQRFEEEYFRPVPLSDIMSGNTYAEPPSMALLITVGDPSRLKRFGELGMDAPADVFERPPGPVSRYLGLVPFSDAS